jgi:hypothetical protein
MPKVVPFLPCECCLFISERKREHVVREAKHVLVIHGDEEYDTCAMAMCHEHAYDYRRVRPVGADVREKAEDARPH